MVVRRVELPCDDAMHSKWTRAVTMKLHRVRWKGTIGASLKHFVSDCSITEGIYAFDTTFKYREASKASFKAKTWSGLEVLSVSLI